MAINPSVTIVKNQIVRQNVVEVASNVSPLAVVLMTGTSSKGERWHLVKQGNVQVLAKDANVSLP